MHYMFSYYNIYFNYLLRWSITRTSTSYNSWFELSMVKWLCNTICNICGHVVLPLCRHVVTHFHSSLCLFFWCTITLSCFFEKLRSMFRLYWWNSKCRETQGRKRNLHMHASPGKWFTIFTCTGALLWLA